MLKKIYKNMSNINFIIVISVFTIAILLLSGFIEILKYSNFEFFNNNRNINLSPSIEYFIPQIDQSTNINDITYNFEDKFTNNTLNNIHFPKNVTQVWLKLKLKGDQADIENIIYLDCEFIKNIEFYIPTTDDKFVLEKPKEYLIFPYINFPKNTDFNKDIYINLDWTSSNFNLLLAKNSDFYIKQEFLTCFYVINLGLLLGMIIINLILFFSSKDNKYLFHSLFTGSLLLTLYCVSGMQRVIFGFTSDNDVIALGSMLSLSWVLFIYSYLDIKNTLPVLNKVFKVSLASLFLSLYVSRFIPGEFTYDILYLYMVIIGFCIITSVYSYFKFKIGSIYYLIGIFILFTGITLYILASYGLLEWNIVTYNTWYLASSMETLLFTIGIITQIKNEKERNKKLQIEVVTDKLTNLYNRRYFEETVIDKIIDFDIKKSTVSMLLLDIDHFKNVNDTYGHIAGDCVLSEASMIIKKCLGKEDILIRWGGEEFVAILPFTNVHEGTVIAENIRITIEKHIFKYVNRTTISIGVAEKSMSESFNDWFKRVDEAMYKAKEGGRNRVSVCYEMESV